MFLRFLYSGHVICIFNVFFRSFLFKKRHQKQSMQKSGEKHCEKDVSAMIFIDFDLPRRPIPYCNNILLIKIPVAI